MKSTFELVIPNCVPTGFSGQGHPALVKTETPFEFFNHLMEQIRSAVNDDRTVYAPLISRHVYCPNCSECTCALFYNVNLFLIFCQILLSKFW